MKKIRMISLTLVLALVLAAAAGFSVNAFAESGKDGADTAKPLTDCVILHETDFGGVNLAISIDAFNALGYQYGDSVDIQFSNGVTLTDQPYYNGYYTQAGESLLVAYPGYDYIRACINYGDDLWLLLALSGDDTATVTLNERGKYLDIQNALNIQYEDEREKYASDLVFANFRSVSAGDITPNTLYRSASPCDNRHQRATYSDALIQAAGVQCVLDLADTDEKIAGYLADESYATPWFQSLYEKGNVIPLSLSMSYSSEDFLRKLAGGLAVMAEHEGPYVVHCTEGKDRTGFACILLEALCGAGYGEIVTDYMITYKNYYGVTLADDPDRYNVLVETMLNPMIQFVAGDGVDFRTADLRPGAEAVLRNAGLTQEQISALRARLTRK